VTGYDWLFTQIGDFDGDGTTDVFWRNSRTGANVVYDAGSLPRSLPSATTTWWITPFEGSSGCGCWW
jgi:hypothetical protein